MNRLNKQILYFLIVQTFCASQTYAADALNYTGRLVHNNGSPVAGPVSLKAELFYTNSTSTVLCDDDLLNVPLNNGVFNVKLNFDCGPTPLTQILAQTPNAESVAIKITDVTNSRSYSYQALHSIPYASVAQQLSRLGATTGDMLKWNGLKWVPGIIDPGGTVTSVTGTAPINVATGTTTPALTISKADSSTDGYLSATDWNTFNNKQGSIAAGTSLQYYRGDKSWQALDTNAVTENSSHLYFTNARVLGLALSGLSATNSAITSTDTVVMALGKTQGQINGLITARNNFLLKDAADTLSGAVTLSNVISTTPTGDIIVHSSPLTAGSAIGKAYIDTALSSKLAKSGGTITGVLTLEDELKLKGSANYVTLKAHASSSEYTLVLPASAGSAGYVLETDGNGNLSWVNMSTVTAASGTVTSASIVDGAIVDADISSSADIAQSKIHNLVTDLSGKLSTTLANNKVFIGNGSSVATAQTLSGDLTITNTGVVTLKNKGTAGTYTSVTTDAQGRVTGGTTPTVVSSVSVTAPVKKTGTSTAPTLSMDPATSTAHGYLKSSDWTTFNNKQPLISASSVLNSGSVSTNLKEALVIKPYGVHAGNNGEVQFFELAANGSNYVALKAPEDIASSWDYILPAVDGNSGDVLTLNNFGVLSWTTITATNVQSAILSLYTIGSNAVVDASDSVVQAFGKLQKQISDLKTSSAGGDLTGNLPNPTISKLQGVGVTTSSLASKNVLKYNGTNWVNSMLSATDLTATGTTSSSTYLAGDNTWKNFNTDLLAAPVGTLTTSGLTKSTAILSSTDSLNSAFTKLLFTQGDYISKSADQNIFGTLAINSLTGSLKVPTPSILTDAVNKGYVDSFGQWTKGASSSLNYTAGYVGVATTTPASELDVNGAIRVTQVCDRTGANCKSTSTSWTAPTPTVQTLSDATTINIDASTGDVFTVTLAGNRTLANPTNLVNGKIYTIYVNQDSTGGRTLIWGSNYIFSSTASSVLGTEASKSSVYVFSTDGSKLFNIGNYVPTIPCSGATVTYSTAGPYQIVVPAGCTKAVVKAWGAGGGNATSYYGGAGGFATGTFTVTAGETLTVQIGGAGGNSDFGSSGTASAGNGGTAGGGQPSGPGGGGYGGGGGSSYVGNAGGGGRSAVYGSSVTSDTFLIAPGGGGAGSGNGGAGGGTNGQDGSGTYGGRGAIGPTGGVGQGSSYIGANGGSWGGGVAGQGGDNSPSNVAPGTGGGLYGLRGGYGSNNCSSSYSSNGSGGGAGGGFGSGGGGSTGCGPGSGVAGGGPGGGAASCSSGYCGGGGGSAGGGGAGNIGAAGGGGGYAGGGGGGSAGAGGGGSGYVFNVRSVSSTTLTGGNYSTVPATTDSDYASPSAQPAKDGRVVIKWQ